MSDTPKFGANNVSLVPPDPKTTYPIVLGKSFFQQQNRRRPTGFVSATYGFKPSSVDQSKAGNISFDKTNATLEFDRRSNTNTTGRCRKIKFQGESKVASDREFFLWFDASSQRMVLERSGIQIKQLKHVREQKQSSANYTDPSKAKMEQYIAKHKKEKRQKHKSKNNKKKSKIVIKPKQQNNNNNNNNNSNNNNSDTSSTRSSSISTSPFHPSAAANTNNNQNEFNNTQFRTKPLLGQSGADNVNKIKDCNNNHNVSNNNNGPTPLFGFNGTWNDDSDSEDGDIFIN